MELIDAVFGRTHDLNGWQECARGALIFGYGLLLVRVAGRRVFGKWSALDIVVSIILGSSLSRALTGSAPLFGTMAACALVVFLHWLCAQAAARSPTLAKLFEGAALPLARDGRLLEEARLRHSVSPADLDEALRQAKVEHVADTKVIVLEPSGTISVQARG
ncbi:DUF421 domain-containing protein [Methylorubrum thiocyanatum]|uniref:Uncharacterized membrane protein YcaP (DUF421 family) n=1 Tax=Methylorubrum thiocyanatum TaxID=47958 RepID=A0AA40VD15_9HYPH|nr:YetF domain-containing protein [Methylorubrum thiocyanatum]MBA8914146.1 uncharacterized membrane protein YcaP (DUF421 family) [Methylorubrum thiocyanatum]